MSKLRRIPTAMTSATHLVAALEQSGLREVERVSELAPLMSWRGQPLPERAEILVRRRQIGATADDLGFVRGADGRYEALVSEILLSRFDRRWFAELEKRYAALAVAAGEALAAPEPPRSAPHPAPVAEPEFAKPPVQRPEPKSAPQPAQPMPRIERRGSIDVDSVDVPTLAAGDASEADLAKVEQDLVAVLGAAKRAASSGSCVANLMVLVAIVAIAGSTRSVAFLVLGLIGCFFLGLRELKRRQERMVQAATAEFRARFGSRAQARELALQRLRREIGKLDGDKRAVVEQLLRRLA